METFLSPRPCSAGATLNYQHNGPCGNSLSLCSSKVPTFQNKAIVSNSQTTSNAVFCFSVECLISGQVIKQSLLANCSPIKNQKHKKKANITFNLLKGRVHPRDDLLAVLRDGISVVDLCFGF